MFKFQTIVSGGGKWTSNLYIEDKRIGIIGLDEGGLFVRSIKLFTLNELNLLIAQLSINSPELADKEIEFLKYEPAK